MTESLAELLRRGADMAPETRFDVGELVELAGTRQRRRRLAVMAIAAAVVGAITVGSFALGGGQSHAPSPAPPLPSPNKTDSPQLTSRPLVYATGSTVHVGDETFDAGGIVGFLDVTDDGVVFVTEDDQVWFHDGTTTQEIGRAYTGPGDFYFAPSYVKTANPGSLVVWTDATSRTGSFDQFVANDTSRRESTAIPFIGRDSQLLYVDEDHVFFNPDKSMPGCWAIDIDDDGLHPCKDPRLFRYDIASGETTKITLAALNAELGTTVRMFARAAPGTDPEFDDAARFNLLGRQLVPADNDGDAVVLSRTSGEEIRLRVPDGYTQPGGEEGLIRVSQWLDDDHIVLWAYEGAGELEPQHGDLLVCRLPDGVCRVAVGRSSALYVAPS